MDVASLRSPRLRDLPMAKRVTAIVLTILLALVLGGSGVSKVMGQQRTIEQFEDWELPDSLRPFVGATEVALAILLLLPWTRFWGAALMGPWALGAVATHVRVGQYTEAPAPVVLGTLGLVAAYLLLPPALARRPMRPT